MGQAIKLLENALCAWEDYRLLDEAFVRVGIRNGSLKQEDLLPPVKHWRELRRHFLLPPTQRFNHSRFCDWGGLTEENSLFSGPELMSEKGIFFEEFPLQLASWIASSRRVFTLSEELALRFVSADYSNYKWSDLLWPFDSFLINLEKPLTFVREAGSTTTGNISGAIVTSISRISEGYPGVEPDGLEIGFFYSGKNGTAFPTEVLTRSEHRQLNDHLVNKRWVKVLKRLERAQDFLRLGEAGNQLDQPAGCMAPSVFKKDELIVEGSVTANLVAGLCLYLEALPSGIVESYGWGKAASPTTRRDVRKIITDEEQICCVEDFHVISPDTMSLFPETLRQGPAYTVTPHWRRAHYRRARGQGNNPNAPRDVYVAPTLIHREQVPEGALPGGSVSSLR